MSTDTKALRQAISVHQNIPRDATILTLLDDLDAAQKHIAELSAKCDAAMGALDEMCDALGIPSGGRADGPSATAALAQARKEALDGPWSDAPDENTPAILAAHPTRSGSHAEFALAMRMVGNRQSKAALVALVNWLLVREAQARAEGFREGVASVAARLRARATSEALTAERHTGEDAVRGHPGYYAADVLCDEADRALLPDSAGPVAARWAARPVEERKALLADALAAEGDFERGLPKGGDFAHRDLEPCRPTCACVGHRHVDFGGRCGWDAGGRDLRCGCRVRPKGGES